MTDRPYPNIHQGRIRAQLRYAQPPRDRLSEILTARQKRILDLLRQEQRPMWQNWISERLDMNVGTVHQGLKRLHHLGLVADLPDGSWAIDGCPAPPVWPPNKASAARPAHPDDARDPEPLHPTPQQAVFAALRKHAPITHAGLIAAAQREADDLPAARLHEALDRLIAADAIAIRNRIGLSETTGLLHPPDDAPTIKVVLTSHLALLLGEVRRGSQILQDDLEARLGPEPAGDLLARLVADGVLAAAPDAHAGFQLTPLGILTTYAPDVARAINLMRGYGALTREQFELIDLFLDRNRTTRSLTARLLQQNLVVGRADSYEPVLASPDPQPHPPSDPPPLPHKLLKLFAPDAVEHTAWLLRTLPARGEAMRFRDLAEGHPSVRRLWRIARKLAHHGALAITHDDKAGAWVARPASLKGRVRRKRFARLPASKDDPVTLDLLYTLMLIAELPSMPAADLQSAGFQIGRLDLARNAHLASLLRRRWIVRAGRGYRPTALGQKVIAEIGPALGPESVRGAAQIMRTSD